MCLMAWLHLRCLDGPRTAVREGCGSLCMARVTNEGWRGRGSRVVEVPDHGCLVTSSSPVPLKTGRVGERWIIGNKLADSLAKAASLDTPWPDMPFTFSEVFSDKEEKARDLSRVPPKHV
ncbi:hypothetical protein TNCV_22291 [Trichonephila clavipes]|nr:hypothetical protein TNCV_22291 [Trichonephila clavipes]